MTLNTGIFDVSDPQNPDRVYSAALLSRILSKHIRDGIVHEDGNEMAVTVTDPPAMTVQVGTGTAMVQGRFCENDAALTLAVPTAHATYPRIDRVVVRLNASPGRTIDIVVEPGTAAPEPAAPALTRTAETWELSLAQVRVEAGATLILSAKITDERGDASLCGVACPAYVPSSVLEIVEGLVMQGMPLVGLPTPGSSSAAATKAYVDSAVSGAIGSFGISDIGIDQDLNMDATVYGIVAQIAPRISASDAVQTLSAAERLNLTGGTGTTYIKVREITLGKLQGSQNAVRVKVEAQGAHYNSGTYLKIYCNDAAASEEFTLVGGSHPSNYAQYQYDVSDVKTGDKIQVWVREGTGANPGQGVYTRNFSIGYDLQVPYFDLADVVTL